MKLTNKSLYNQAKGEIIKLIKKDYSFMSKLPSEQQLAEQMGISRNTVREALKSLENEGILVSRHGVGTFVSSTPAHLKHNIAVLNSTTEIIKNNGYVSGTKSVYYDKRKAPPEILKRIDLMEDEETEFLYIERVRTADNKPIAYVEDYIPYFDGLMEHFSIDTEVPLFPFLDKRGMSSSFSNCSIYSVLSNEKIQNHLSLHSACALLQLRQSHYSAKGDLVLYSDSYFLTNELEFSLVRRCLD